MPGEWLGQETKAYTCDVLVLIAWVAAAFFSTVLLDRANSLRKLSGAVGEAFESEIRETQNDLVNRFLAPGITAGMAYWAQWRRRGAKAMKSDKMANWMWYLAVLANAGLLIAICWKLTENVVWADYEIKAVPPPDIPRPPSMSLPALTRNSLHIWAFFLSVAVALVFVRTDDESHEGTVEAKPATSAPPPAAKS